MTRRRRPTQHERERAAGGLDYLKAPGRRPSDYGLTRAEILAEARRLLAAGWQPWEIRARLSRPDRVPGEGWPQR